MSNLPTHLQAIEHCFYNDPAMPDDALNSITAYEESKSSQLWQRHVSDCHRHFMLLSDEEWPKLMLSDEYYLGIWHEAWNDNDASPMAGWINQVGLAPDHCIYVHWMKEICCKLPVLIFLNHWINFLYEDEGVIVVSPESHKALILSNGRIWGGTIPEHCSFQ